MLVLSRRQDEKIVFPTLGIEIEVVRVAGKVVRIGVDAPRDVRVLRGELAGQELTRPENKSAANRSAANKATAADEALSSEQRHAARNRLNKAMLGLQVLQAQVECGETANLESLIDKILSSLADLNTELTGQTCPMGDDSRLPERSDRPRRRALIVDDSANEAQLMAQYLQLSGYDTVVVHNGREAIDWLRKHEHPDVVLMDMNMPEMDGAEAIRVIRQDRLFDKLRVFGVSGLEQTEAGVETGVEQWFTKPVSARHLVRALDQPERSTAV